MANSSPELDLLSSEIAELRPLPLVALRALEIKAEVILKATKVDGVYSADPMKDPSATRFDCITYQEVLEKQLKVMDASAISLCMDNDLPIIVFNMRKSGNIVRVVRSDAGIGTRVCLEKPPGQ